MTTSRPTSARRGRPPPAIVSLEFMQRRPIRGALDLAGLILQDLDPPDSGP